MQIRLTLLATIVSSLLVCAGVPSVAQQVSPDTPATQDYIPPQNLDPNLMAIQIKRLEDRVLALETTNERLVDRVRVLTDNYNALIEFLNSSKE